MTWAFDVGGGVVGDGDGDGDVAPGGHVGGACNAITMLIPGEAKATQRASRERCAAPVAARTGTVEVR